VSRPPPLPSISVLTPSLNQAPFLEEALLSVLGQAYPDLEYRVLDGGSTDGSLEIIRRYQGRLAGWRSRPDGGQAAALAEGFAESRGEVLAYLNSDDAYLPGALRAAGEAFAADPDLDLVYGDIVFVDAQGRPLAIDVLPTFSWEDLRRVCVIPQQAAFWRRRAYEGVGGIDPDFHFCMDYDLFLRIAEAGRVRHLPRLMARFRWHAAAKSSVAKATWDAENLLLQRRYLGRAGWSRTDWLRMKWLTARQLGAIVGRTLQGERFPCWTPARWQRLARRKLREGLGTGPVAV